MFKKFIFLFIVAVFGFSLTGCTNNTQNNPAITIEEQLASQSKINKFSTTEEIKSFFEENSLGRSYSYSYGIEKEMMWDVVDKESLNAAPRSGTKTVSNIGSSDDFSQTNVQVKGVDEADIIKTDGKYVYALVKNDLFIINAYPAEKAVVLSKIEFKSRPDNIYIDNNRLVVFGYDDKIYETEMHKNFRRRSNYVFLKIFDTSDKKNPKQIRDLDIEGDYVNSRMIGNYVYFVSANYNYYYIEEEPVLPRIIEDGNILTNKCEAGVRCFNPNSYYFDIPYQNYNFTVITSINIQDPKEDIQGEAYLLSGNQNMYVSQNNIYITYTKYINEYQLEMDVVREIVYPRLSDKEKEKNKDISKELEKTVIHKIAINKGVLEYQTFGEVTGYVLNQFSMDENGDYFRIATTKGRTWSRFDDESRKSYNNLYVLDGDMKVVGSLENLAEDEQIYSVRFMQDRAYMVTFKQTDPLFVIDLKDPKRPTVLGELKIPGFSNYLHPYDANTMIGIGKDTDVNEWGGVTTRGIKLSLFDVSDVSSPKEIDTYVMGDRGSDSIALYDHKAFLFSRDKNLLVIPVSLQNSGEFGWSKLTFTGAAVFNITRDGFKLSGKIDHSDGGRISNQDYWGGYTYYDNTVKRSLYINDALYTFSNKYLKINNLNDLSLVSNIELIKEKQEDDFEIIN